MPTLAANTIPLNQYTPAENFLSGQIIMVTGASDGIGKAIAIACASYAATVILLGRNVKKLEAVYDEIESQGGPQAVIHPMDFEKADEPAYQQLAAALKENFNQLDGVIHCAANLGAHCPIVNSNYDLWQKTLQTNLTAPYLLTRACYPLLQASDTARVIFTSDAVASKNQAHWGAYSISKVGTDTLMHILAQEWETNTNITVNSLDPGPARTTLRKLAFPGEDPATLPTPTDTVLPYLYLLEKHARDRSGQRLTWDSRQKELSDI